MNNRTKAREDWIKGYLLQGKSHQLNKEYQDAINSYTMVLELDKTNFDAYNQRSSARLAIGDYQGAMEDLQKAKKLSEQ